LLLRLLELATIERCWLNGDDARTAPVTQLSTQTMECKMSEAFLCPIELSDAELDAVAAGQANGLVAINIEDVANNNNILNNAFQNFLNHNNILNDFLNGNNVQVPIGIAAAVLGLAGASSLAHGRP